MPACTGPRFRLMAMTLMCGAGMAVLSHAPATAASAAASTAAPTAPRTWIYSGADLLRLLEGKEVNEANDPELRRMLSGARGQAYVAAVADATRGKRWCDPVGTLPHELADRVYTHLRALSPASLEGNAAVLATEALAKSHPCKPG